MIKRTGKNISKAILQDTFGAMLKEKVRMAEYTSAKIGGVVDYLILVENSLQLEETITNLWKLELPYMLIGGGSNILFAEEGLPEIIVLNHARGIEVDLNSQPPQIRAESGAFFSKVALTAAKHSLSGMEWAVNLPGSVGGAVYGNAGAFGGETSQNLILAEILQGIDGKQTWANEDFAYGYRSSKLKNFTGETVILSAVFELRNGKQEEIQELMSQNRQKRQRKQPPGACTGSMFKNPSGDYAGRLIEACGLKGKNIGDARISEKHANFFINEGDASSNDFLELITLAKNSVYEKFGVELELEVELIGEW